MREIDNAVVWDEFEAYEQVIQKLAQGWQPIGYVSRTPGETSDTNDVFRESFEIASEITEAGLDECLDRCRKIRLARDIEYTWEGGWRFLLTPDYFERALNESIIRKASDELRYRLGPPPYWHQGMSPALVTVGQRHIRLIAKRGYVFFESYPAF